MNLPKGKILNYEPALIGRFLIISCSSIGEGSASGKGVFSTSGTSKIPIKIGSRSRSRYKFFFVLSSFLFSKNFIKILIQWPSLFNKFVSGYRSRDGTASITNAHAAGPQSLPFHILPTPHIPSDPDESSHILEQHRVIDEVIHMWQKWTKTQMNYNVSILV